MIALVMAARVLVLSSQSAPADEQLIETLQIQLTGVAEVVAGPALEGATLPERVDFAVAQVAEHEATLAVWLERGDPHDGEVDVVLYVVGHKQGRLLVEVFHIPDTDGPALDRAIALKVGEVLDGVLAPPPPEEPEEVAAPAPVAWVADPPPARKPPPSRVRSVPWIGLGVRGAAGLDQPAAQGGASLAVGFRRPTRAVDADVYLVASAHSGMEREDAAGAVEVADRGVALGLAVHRPFGRLRAGGRAELGARFIGAKGVTALGTPGEKSVVVPEVWLGGEAELSTGARSAVRLGAGLGWAPDRQRLTINDEPVLDLGRFRPIVELSVVIFIP